MGLRPADAVLLALRVTLELGIVAALGYWGAVVGGGTVSKFALAVGAPAVGFGLWGAVDFRDAGRYAERLRLAQELVISGVAAVALYGAGAQALALALALLSVGYHALLYRLGGSLLRPAGRTSTSR
jgi:hypothetical protein